MTSMSWNFRVLRRTVGHEVIYGIHEVYYDDAGTPRSCSSDAIEPYGDTVDDLRQELQHMVAALDEPVLDYDTDFPEDDPNA